MGIRNKTGDCRHFNSFSNDACEAGVNYQALIDGQDITSIYRGTPCLHRNRVGEAATKCVCEKLAPYSVEEATDLARQEKAEFAAIVERMQKVQPLVGQIKRDNKGKCGGESSARVCVNPRDEPQPAGGLPRATPPTRASGNMKRTPLEQATKAELLALIDQYLARRFLFDEVRQRMEVELTDFRIRAVLKEMDDIASEIAELSKGDVGALRGEAAFQYIKQQQALSDKFDRVLKRLDELQETGNYKSKAKVPQ